MSSMRPVSHESVSREVVFQKENLFGIIMTVISAALFLVSLTCMLIALVDHKGSSLFRDLSITGVAVFPLLGIASYLSINEEDIVVYEERAQPPPAPQKFDDWVITQGEKQHYYDRKNMKNCSLDVVVYTNKKTKEEHVYQAKDEQKGDEDYLEFGKEILKRIIKSEGLSEEKAKKRVQKILKEIEVGVEEEANARIQAILSENENRIKNEVQNKGTDEKIEELVHEKAMEERMEEILREKESAIKVELSKLLNHITAGGRRSDSAAAKVLQEIRKSVAARTKEVTIKALKTVTTAAVRNVLPIAALD